MDSSDFVYLVVHPPALSHNSGKNTSTYADTHKENLQ